jgi:hypothetical protein
MSDELKKRNILKLILIVRFACATLDVGHPLVCLGMFGQLVCYLSQGFGSSPKSVPEFSSGLL